MIQVIPTLYSILPICLFLAFPKLLFQDWPLVTLIVLDIQLIKYHFAVIFRDVNFLGRFYLL
jgi:hypothetical protein